MPKEGRCRLAAGEARVDMKMRGCTRVLKVTESRMPLLSCVDMKMPGRMLMKHARVDAGAPAPRAAGGLGAWGRPVWPWREAEAAAYSLLRLTRGQGTGLDALLACKHGAP
jgi:hypothetical protein